MRKQTRIVFRSIFRCKVKDRASGRLMGYVADVSEGGLRLLCDQPLKAGETYAVRLAMRNPEGEMEEIDVDCLCLWTRENPRTGYFESGTRIDDLLPGYERWLANLRRVRKQPA